MLYRPSARSAAIPSKNEPLVAVESTTAILRDRILRDLLDELEVALSVIEATERRSRSPRTSARLTSAGRAIDAAILYLRDVRG
jgi:hypothetical protein